jgi:hypothetical protein
MVFDVSLANRRLFQNTVGQVYHFLLNKSIHLNKFSYSGLSFGHHRQFSILQCGSGSNYSGMIEYSVKQVFSTM